MVSLPAAAPLANVLNGASTLDNPAALVPDWQQIPAWTTPPGKT